MRAAFYEKLGPAREVLQVAEMPEPEPQAGEVRVRIATSGVNPSDVKMRMGTGSAANQYPRTIPHSDGAGTIDAVGQGVPASRIGERVWLWNARWNRAFGTAAEFVTLPTEQAVALLDSTDFAAGACFGIPALTAWQAVETDGGVAPGQWVLVNGGAGAVGHYAVQMAVLKGARVITTVSSAAKGAHAKAAGAEVVIDRKQEDVPSRIKAVTGGKGVARAIEVDFSGNIAWLPEVMADYGLIAIYGSSAREAPVQFGPSILGNIGYRFFIVYNQPLALRHRAIAALTELLAAKKLQHSIAATYPLSQIAAAHEAVERGTAMGNVVIAL
ncbi:NADPH:quinone reductase [Dongia rigui]|uniref:NADPH:quinone reductase n=1 Tax=Dongia rigui TaxID=940149 RepID=A0ABU5DYU3_9PROT|nr:NADPH:quinone reductase [Dongia rigui]MDY0872104.1 NADPH:quinone reductase [Dongia rigui]